MRWPFLTKAHLSLANDLLARFFTGQFDTKFVSDAVATNIRNTDRTVPLPKQLLLSTQRTLGKIPCLPLYLHTATLWLPHRHMGTAIISLVDRVCMTLYEPSINKIASCR